MKKLLLFVVSVGAIFAALNSAMATPTSLPSVAADSTMTVMRLDGGLKGALSRYDGGYASKKSRGH